MNFQSRLHVSLHDHFGLRYHFYVEKLKKKTNNDYLTNVAIFQKLLLLNFTQCYSMLLNVTQCYSILLTFTQFMLIGYDDHCIPEEWCVDSNESPGFQCIHKSSVLLILLFHEILYLIFILD